MVLLVRKLDFLLFEHFFEGLSLVHTSPSHKSFSMFFAYLHQLKLLTTERTVELLSGFVLLLLFVVQKLVVF